MPKILVPIDFSPTSLNAAIYASHFGKAISASRVTLLSVVSESITGSDGTPVSGGTDERDKAVMHQLEELQVSLYEMTGVPTSIVLRAGDFADLMEKFMREHTFDFVVMGVTGSNAFEQVFGSSYAVDVIAKSSTPVLVVPPEANFHGIRNVAIAVELHNMDELVPLKELDRWLHWLKPNVHIAHVNEQDSKEITDAENEELLILKEKLILFNPSEHLLQAEDGFSDALNQMALDFKIDLLMTFPRRHSFFDLLFKTSHTRKLVFHSKVPVLALPHDYIP
jgi:nucleotide-binding universal stress UspA family protein